MLETIKWNMLVLLLFKIAFLYHQEMHLGDDLCDGFYFVLTIICLDVFFFFLMKLLKKECFIQSNNFIGVENSL